METLNPDGPRPDSKEPDEGPSMVRHEWQEPKLAFLEPTLTPHGELTKVTGQFFGGFSPPAD